MSIVLPLIEIRKFGAEGSAAGHSVPHGDRESGSRAPPPFQGLKDDFGQGFAGQVGGTGFAGERQFGPFGGGVGNTDGLRGQ
jgi:hypothetical protein